jgi:hypothetical protein
MSGGALFVCNDWPAATARHRGDLLDIMDGPSAQRLHAQTAEHTFRQEFREAAGT